MRRMMILGASTVLVGAFLGPASGSTAAIEPQNLPTGPPPTVAYLEPQSHSIVAPGRPAIHVNAGIGSAVLRVRGGYLVGIQHERANGDGSFTPTYHEIKFVSADGKIRRRIAKGGRFQTDFATVSSDGRLVAFNLGLNGTHRVISVMKTRTGRIVARRDFKYQKDWRMRTFVVAVTPRRVLLHRQRDRATLWWNLHTNRLRVFDRRPSERPHASFTYPVPGASISSHQVAVYAGDHNTVLTIPKDSGKRWNTVAHEIVQSWSPDDRHVLTAVILDDLNGPFATTMRVRDARTGAVRATFSGWFQIEPQVRQSPVWETSDAFLMPSYSQLIPDGDGSGADHIAMVRCRVSTATCETAGPIRPLPLVGIVVPTSS